MATGITTYQCPACGGTTVNSGGNSHKGGKF